MKIALLLKLGVLALVVVLGFDGASVARQAYRADREAGDAARVATRTFMATKNVQQAYDAAVAELPAGDVIDPETFAVDDLGGVTLTLRSTADTVVLGRLRDTWTTLTVEGSANRPS